MNTHTELTNSDDIVNLLVNQIEENHQAKNEEISDSEDSPKNKDPGKKQGYRDLLPKCNDFYEQVIPSLTEEEFFYYFRMSRNCFALILHKLSIKVKISNIEKKLLFTIYMLSTRESFCAVGTRFGMAKGASYQYFCEIIDGLLVMFKQHVSWPSDVEFSHIEQGFKPKTGGYIPAIIGAIDGCHIEIKKPSRYSIYCNERNTHSIVLQAVCDHHKIFTDVYVGAPGCLHAERVFRNSPLAKQIETLVPQEYHIVGRNYFPLLKNLVVPFNDVGILTESQMAFNDCLLKACATTEQAFKMLVARFRRLSYLDTSKPELANKMVCTCIILHNHILMHDAGNDGDNILATEDTEIFLNIDEGNTSGTDADYEGLMKRNYLLSLFDFI